MLAYPLSKPELKGSALLRKLVVLTLFFTGGLIPNYLVVNTLGLVDTVWAMLLPFADALGVLIPQLFPVPALAVLLAVKKPE